MDFFFFPFLLNLRFWNDFRLVGKLERYNIPPYTPHSASYHYHNTFVETMK